MVEYQPEPSPRNKEEHQISPHRPERCDNKRLLRQDHLTMETGKEEGGLGGDWPGWEGTSQAGRELAWLETPGLRRTRTPGSNEQLRSRLVAIAIFSLASLSSSCSRRKDELSFDGTSGSSRSASPLPPSLPPHIWCAHVFRPQQKQTRKLQSQSL